MKRIFVCLISMFFVTTSLADTFTNIQTGQSFNGYATSVKKANLTQVNSAIAGLTFIDLNKYNIERNYLGRKSNIYTFLINDQTDLIAQIEEFEKYLPLYANQGPLLIAIEIDAPDIRTDLALRLCRAIESMDYCRTVAFIKGGKYNGAFGNSAIVALTCNQLYMNNKTSLGGKSTVFPPTQINADIIDNNDFVSDQIKSQWKEYYLKLAEKKSFDPLIISAFSDENIAIIEINEDGKVSFAAPTGPDPNKQKGAYLHRKGHLLSLTAEDAQRLGLSKDTVANDAQFYQSLSVSNAKKIRDTRMIQPKRDFLITSGNIRRLMRKLNDTEARTETLFTDMYNIEQTISNVNRAGMEMRYGVTNPYDVNRATTEMDFYQWQDMLAEHDDLLDQLLANLSRQIPQYRNLLLITDKNSDLQPLSLELQAKYQQARTRYQQNLNRHRYSLTPAEATRYYQRYGQPMNRINY